MTKVWSREARKTQEAAHLPEMLAVAALHCRTGGTGPMKLCGMASSVAEEDMLPTVMNGPESPGPACHYREK